jgi:hypothetical protein
MQRYFASGCYSGKEEWHARTGKLRCFLMKDKRNHEGIQLSTF